MYMRFMKDRKIVRVARMNTLNAELIAFYPSKKPEIFYGEVSYEIDDVPKRKKINKSDIGDEILKRLLVGETIEKIVGEYEPAGDGEYHLCKRGEQGLSARLKAKIFSITEQEESVSK